MVDAKAEVQANPNSADAHKKLAEAYEHSHRYDDAAGALKEALRLKPDYEVAYRALASVYEKLGRYKEAIPIYKNLVELTPGSVDVLVGLGAAYLKTGRNDDAITTFLEVLSLKPDYAFVYHATLGLANFNKGFYAEAIDAYRRATEIKPPYGQLDKVYRELGRSYTKIGRLNEAAEAWKQAIARDPDSEESYLGLGNTYEQQHRWSDELEMYKQTILSHPKFAKVQFNIAATLANMGRSLRGLRLSRMPFASIQNTRGLSGLGQLYARLGKFDEAIQNLQHSIRLEPFAPESFHQLALTYFVTGRYEESVEAGTEAVRRESYLKPP